MAAHSGILAWKIPWTEKPGRLQSMGLQRVRHTSETECTCTHRQKDRQTHTQTYCLLLGAGVRHSAHGKGHEEGGLTYTKAGSSLTSSPGNYRASTPITRAYVLYYFVLSPTPLTLWGAVPHHLVWRRNNLELQLIIIPGCDRNVSTYKLI